MTFQKTSSDRISKTKPETLPEENDSSITQLDADTTLFKQEADDDESALYDNFPHEEEEEVEGEDSGIPEPEDSEEE